MATVFTYPISDFDNGISVEDFINEIKNSSITAVIEDVQIRSSENNGSIQLGDMDVDDEPQDLTVYIYFTTDLSTGEEAQLDTLVFNHVEPEPELSVGSDGIVAFFMKHLLNESRYSKKEIEVGMLTEVYSSEGALPNPPPSGVSYPSFAVIDDGSGVEKLAYWDYNSQSSWKITDFSWVNPINNSEWIIRQNNKIGTGSNDWKYVMGPEFRILSAADGGKISNFSVKFGDTANHAWAIRKSTTVGSKPPELSSYTNVVASGNYSNEKKDAWETITGFSPITVAENEWYIAQVFVGKGGQAFEIDSSYLNGKLATVYSGTYAFIGSSNPGSTSVPTTRSTSSVYGLCAVEISTR